MGRLLPSPTLCEHSSESTGRSKGASTPGSVCLDPSQDMAALSGKAVRPTRWPQLQGLVAGPCTAPSTPPGCTPPSAGPALTTPFPLYLIPNQPGSGPCCTDRTHNYVLISFQRCMALSLRGTSGALHKHNLRGQRVRFGVGVGKSQRIRFPE